MSRRFDNEGYFEAKKDAKRLNKMEKDIEKLFRLTQRKDSTTSTQKTIANPGSTPGIDTISLSQISDLGSLAGKNLNLLDVTLNLADTLLSIDSIQFNVDAVIDSPVEGELHWNDTDKTVNIPTDTPTTIQVGQEDVIRGINKSGVQLNNGQVVYISGVDTARPILTIAKADTVETSMTTIGIVTSDIAVDAQGFATVFGLVRDLDTSGMSAGDRIYLSPTTAGGFTNNRPATPNFVVSLGVVIVVGASDGTIFFNVLFSEAHGFLNGSTVESFDLTVDSTGGVVTATLERSGGGDLTLNFSSGLVTLDATPALTIVLTALGTDTVPIAQYLFIPESTKVLTLDTAFPTTEHIKIAYLLVESPATVEANEGCRINQNWNDHGSGTNAQGHMTHIGERIRRQGVVWFSGVDGNGTSDYLTLALNSSLFLANAGVIYQMHQHNFPAFTQGVGSEVLIVNDSVTPFLPSADLYDDVTADSTGTNIGANKYFNLVFWGVGNKSGQPEFIMCNLPGGFYNTQSAAENDVNSYDDLSIPREFGVDSSTGFLISRITIRMGTTWTFVSTIDLRGTSPSSAGGAGSIHTRYTDAEAIAAIEAELTLDLLGDVTIPNTKSLSIGAAATGLFAMTATSGEYARWERTGANAGGWKTQISHLGVPSYGSIFWDALNATSDFIIRDSSSNIVTYVDTSVGGFGIGITPTRELHISGARNDFVASLLNTDGNGDGLFIQSNGDLASEYPLLVRTDAITNLLRVQGDGNIGIGIATATKLIELGADSAQKPTTNTWTITSDARIKSVVGDYALGLDVLMQVQPRIWNYKNKYNFKECHGNHIGIVADEIETVLPSTVKIGKHHYNHRQIDTGETEDIEIGRDDNDKPIMETRSIFKEEHDTVELKTFDSNDLMYVMINAIKELAARIIELEKR